VNTDHARCEACIAAQERQIGEVTGTRPDPSTFNQVASFLHGHRCPRGFPESCYEHAGTAIPPTQQVYTDSTFL
jgi:hypothetical protein